MGFFRFFAVVGFVFVSFVYCLGQTLTVTTQAEVDAFDPSTTILSGFLRIDEDTDTDDPITNLDNLSNITHIGGYLDIANANSLANLDAFSNLTHIGGYLRVRSNNSLTNLGGFSNLTSIDGCLFIYSNGFLADINGFSNLASIGGCLSIEFEDSLMTMDGFSSLASIGGYLEIDNNPFLDNINGFSNLTSIDGFFKIKDNASLNSIDGFSSLATIGGALTIRDNLSINNIDGLSNLTYIGTSLNIRNNAALSDCCGIQNVLDTPGGVSDANIFISDNPSECSSLGEIMEYCSTSIGIALDSEPLNYSIYPNPFKQNFQIGIAGNTTILDVQVYNSIGQKVWRSEMLENIIVDADDWAKGVYSIIIYDKAGEMLGVEKVVRY